MTIQNNISSEHKPVSFRELAKLKNENLENTEVKNEKPIDHQAVLLDHLKTVTETPGALTRADQRNLANVAEKSKLLSDPNDRKEREANEKFVAQLRAKRAKKENIVEAIKPVEINPAAAIPVKIQSAVAETDASGSTMLSDDLPAKVPELAKSSDVSIVPPAAENVAINTPATGAIMSETAAPMSEIAVETAKVSETIPPVSAAPIIPPLAEVAPPVVTIPAPVAEVSPPVVPIAEQFGVANVPLANVPVVETPVVVSAEPPVEIVAAPPIVQKVAAPIIPVVSTPEIKAPETVLPPVAPIIEEKTAEIGSEIPVTSLTEPVTDVVPPVAPLVSPVTEVAVSSPETSPVAMDTSTSHRNISSLPNDSFASAYAKVGGGGVELPVDEEKKK
jgi:hypothetical protein